MKFISHRRNTIEELKATPTEYGVEVDIRSDNGKLVIHHDPFASGDDFEEWIKHYEHSTLILNVKEEGLEARLIDLMKQHEITDYFFLDQSFPFLIKWSKLGERHCAVRVSEFESIETALTLAGKIDWVWIGQSIDQMGAVQRAEPAWLYWRARGLAATNHAIESQALYAKIADQFNFYGQLAAEELGRPIVTPVPP